MFILKKIISRFLLPISLSIEFSLAGLFLLWFTGKQRAGKVFVSIGVILMLLLSLDAVSNLLLKPIETRYEPYNQYEPYNPGSSDSGTDKGIIPEGESPIKFVVVLGSGYTSDPKLPPASQLDESGLVRLVEGIRIYRKQKGSKLILSGGVLFDPVPNAEVMARVAQTLGISKNDIILESQSKDTQDEAGLIKSIVHNDRFVLVTSASHMPRSVAMFRKLGMNPLPAPAGHMAKNEQGFSPDLFFPRAKSIYKAETAFHEYLGLAWAKLRGKI